MTEGCYFCPKAQRYASYVRSTEFQEQFEHVIATDDKLKISEFLNDQKISDVAELIYENPDYESQILANLSIHRAAGVFRILDVAEQKSIIKDLPPFKTAELLNELPADDRTSFLEELPSGVVKETTSNSWIRRSVRSP